MNLYFPWVMGLPSQLRIPPFKQKRRPFSGIPAFLLGSVCILIWPQDTALILFQPAGWVRTAQTLYGWLAGG